MSRFTREQRQQIIREFALANGGSFDAGAFLSEVGQVGASHPAWEWFQWDNDKAAREYRLDQARDFARGLVVRFEVQTVERGSMKIVSQTVPFVTSPVDQRRHGGGYVLTDPDDPKHMAELCRQAAQAMRWFISRYSAAIERAEGDIASLERVREQLETASSAT